MLLNQLGLTNWTDDCLNEMYLFFMMFYKIVYIRVLKNTKVVQHSGPGCHKPGLPLMLHNLRSLRPDWHTVSSSVSALKSMISFQSWGYLDYLTFGELKDTSAFLATFLEKDQINLQWQKQGCQHTHGSQRDANPHSRHLPRSPVPAELLQLWGWTGVHVKRCGC